jgi:ABC-type transport system substrate-binding protein
LRKGVKFHDGTDFNAEAVKWNIDSVLKAGRSLASTVDSVEVIDSNTVRFHLKEWANSALNELFWAYPIVSPAAFEKLGKEGMQKHPVGTGPFKFDSMKDDVFIKYVRNENYWQKGLPYLDGIEWRIIVDNNTAMNSLLAKEIDLAVQLPAEMIQQIKERSKDIVGDAPATKLGLTGVGLISDSANPNSPFADVRVRKALSYAIDKKALAETIMHGYATPSNQYGVPGGWSFNPNLDPYDYNPQKAKQLLAEAGYPNGFKTKLSSMAAYSTLTAAVQGYLADVGIAAEINIVEPAKFNAMVTSDGWEGLVPYFYLTDNELSSILTEHFGPKSEIYGTHTIRPEKVQQLNIQFNAETDFETRKKLAHELQRNIFDEYHLFTSLYVMQTPTLKHPYLMDDGFFTTTGKLFTPEKMWIKKK